jgi:NhaA family Na+:H+ antiporter
MSRNRHSSTAPKSPIEVITSPFLRFARMEAAGGILLMASTVIAVVWANSAWAGSYRAVWDAPVDFAFGPFSLTESAREWINDGLMSIFFFLVGLEIKREVLIGELSSVKQAMFPLVAALGGTILPALIFTAVNHGSVAERGWGIPMATDIAFALGVLALLGNRVPLALKVFVTALAIVDDIFAVLVIAVFYNTRLHQLNLVLGACSLGLAMAANRMGVRKPIVYAAIGVVAWAAIFKSGVHATIAGVLFAFTIPARTYLDRARFLKSSRRILDRFEAADAGSSDEHAAVETLEENCELVQSPLHRIERLLQPWVSFLIMPLFALANAGVPVLGNFAAVATQRISIGVFLGLFVGKPLGVWLFAWLSVKSKLALGPTGVSWRKLFGASWLCGIGFTMSLFIATLAFGPGALLDIAKIATMAASVAAGVAGSVVLSFSARGSGEEASLS